MTEYQEIRMVKSDREIVVDIATSLIGLAITYYVLNPSAVDDLKQWVNRQVDRLAHKLSVWSTRQSIRSLPETDE